ncbi:MAG: hypothetical protein R3C12_17975 [Planctomycetaceae bacterium]
MVRRAGGICQLQGLPQESSGIVEWNRRLLLLREWGQSAHANDQVYSGKKPRTWRPARASRISLPIAWDHSPTPRVSESVLSRLCPERE